MLDYHIHTELCGHASGSVDDYIMQAINKDLREIGFSDHAPLPEGQREGVTMLPSDMEPYIKLIEEKMEKYKNRIAVKIGFEIDFPLTSAYEGKYLTDSRLDYLIGSCHFLGDWAFDHPDNISEFKNRDINDVYSGYYQIIRDLIRSGLFNIVGHFDLVKKFGHRASIDLAKIIEGLASAVAENRNMAVEINTAGLRKPVSEIYPSDEIIDILFNANTPVTLGSDSHKPEEVGYSFPEALAKLKKAGYRKISGFSKRRRYEINI